MFGGKHDEWWLMPAAVMIVAGVFLFFDPFGMKKVRIQYFVQNGAGAPLTANGGLTGGGAGGTAATAYPQPGEVGFKGNPGSLIQSGPRTGVYTITGTQTLNNCAVSAPIHWDGQGGKLTLTNCVIDVGSTATGAIMAVSGGTLEIRNSTIKAVATNSSGVIHGSAVKLIYDSDISGGGDGVNSVEPGSIIQHNYIHDLAQDPNCANIHNDGVQIYDGQGNITIKNNRIELPSAGCNGNANVFTQGANIGEIRIDGNYLKGGESTLKNQNGTMMITNNTFAANSNINGATGACCTTKYYSTDGGTGAIGAWATNKDDTGLDIPHP